MKTLLVIGGTGYFGKSFLDCFKRGMLEKWDISKVLIMSRNPIMLHEESPELLDPRVQMLAEDIGTAHFLPEADYVIHAAASTDASKYLSQPVVEKENIQIGTANYVRLAKKFHSNSKILYVSSGAVYGVGADLGRGFREEDASGDIGLMSIGKQGYASAKRESENCIRQLGEMGLDVAIARCFAFVGPYLPRDRHFAIGNFLEDGLCRRDINVSSNHLVYRSFMYSDDLIEWLMAICQAASPSCPTYNVGSDECVEIGDLAKNIATRFGVNLSIASDRSAGTDFYIPSIEKAKKLLQLKLNYDLSHALNSTIQRLSR